MSDLARLKIWDDAAIRDGLSFYLEWRRTDGRPNFALLRRLPHRSTRQHPARARFGLNSTA